MCNKIFFDNLQEMYKTRAWDIQRVIVYSFNGNLHERRCIVTRNLVIQVQTICTMNPLVHIVIELTKVESRRKKKKQI